MARTNTRKRGNDILFVHQGEMDAYDHYKGPLGGDVRQSMRSRGEVNRDDVGGMQVQKVGRGYHGPKFRRSGRGDDGPY